MSVLLEARNLSLPGRLEPATLTLDTGTLTCLVGPNGSGKTSLLHALAGIGRPSGTVEIAGEDVRNAPPGVRQRLLTFLPAARDVKWPLTGDDLVALGGGSAEAARGLKKALELDAVADRRVDRLSTGERSRLLIARALAPCPRVLLLDEPTANLDPLWRIRLMEMLAASVRANGQAALVAIHDLDAAARHADRIIVMDGGRLVGDGAPRAILEEPIVPYVFGIVRVEGVWRPVSRSADRRSSP
jgi:iron complex transport system ATP-binding protein